jgi:hypothetical protein
MKNPPLFKGKATDLSSKSGAKKNFFYFLKEFILLFTSKLQIKESKVDLSK